MKVSIKSKKEIDSLREGGKILAEALHMAAQRAKLGWKERISTAELNQIAEKVIRSHKAIPAFLGYPSGYDGEPFPAAMCVSLNDEVVHGIPRRDRFLEEGDLVKMDVGVKYQGLFTDAALTVAVGKVSKKAQRIMDVTKKSLELGIEQIYPGSRLGNYGNAVERYVKMNGFSVVKRLIGHGVGYEIHEALQIPNYGKIGEGVKLKSGMVLALEPMVNEKSDEVYLDYDGFTFKTDDGGLSAHFEHTVVVTEDGYEILTMQS